MGLSSQREIFKVSNLKPRKPTRESIQNGKHLYDADLSFQGQETQHSTHALHTYVAAINPPLARKLIETYIPEGENILDPFSGGGGVLVEAMLSGRSSAGAEVNPLGVIIAKAKTTHISKDKILKIGEQIIDAAKKIKKIDQAKKDPKIAFWFKDKNLEEILSITQALDELKLKEDLKNLFRAILSATIRDVMLTYRGEVRLRKLQGRDYDKFNPDTFEAFKKRYTLAAERVSTLPKNVKADVGLRDIRNLPFGDEEFYGIITSPPYADDKNGVGYFQFSKNMLAFLGFSPEQIKECRSKFLGMTLKDKVPPKSKSLLKSLENVKREKPEKYAEGVAFYHDYAEGLAEMARVVREKIIIVIGNRVLARTEFDNAAITVEIFKNLGVELEHHYTRELTKKRIPNLGGDGGGINLEHILVFKK